MVPWDQVQANARCPAAAAWDYTSRVPATDTAAGFQLGANVKGEREWLHLTVRMALTTWSC